MLEVIVLTMLTNTSLQFVILLSIFLPPIYCLLRWIRLEENFYIMRVALFARFTVALAISLLLGAVNFGYDCVGGVWTIFAFAHLPGFYVVSDVMGLSVTDGGYEGSFTCLALSFSFLLNVVLILTFCKVIDRVIKITIQRRS